MKPPVYRHAVLVAFSLGLLLLPMGCYNMSVSFKPTEPDTPFPPEDTRLGSKGAEEQGSRGEELTKGILYREGSSSAPTSSKQVENSRISQQPRNSGTLVSGNFRLSNQTNQPVRLALLSRRTLVKGSSSGETNQALPVHWDFAPKEGSEKGLILSLPNGNLKLEKGDILVAFAQDGSRRYWGPYVVGETPLPTWNPQKKEWQLILSQ